MARKLNWSAISAALAALMGGAVAFVFLAMPGAIFEQLIGMTGLSGVLAAAQPPLGTTARIAAAAAAGLGSAAFVFLGLRAMEQPKRRSYKVPPAPPVEAPRVRKADAHPDAPPRKPIFAGSEFGEPAFPELDEAPEAPPQPSKAAEHKEPETIEAVARRLPAAPPSEASIGELMQRLEHGIRGSDAPPAAPPAPADQELLRGVIAELRRMSRAGN